MNCCNNQCKVVLDSLEPSCCPATEQQQQQQQPEFQCDGTLWDESVVQPGLSGMQLAGQLSTKSDSDITPSQRIASAMSLTMSSPAYHLIRGVSLRKTLRQARTFWLTDPHSRSFSEKEQLYKASEPTDAFAMFISHTWLTPGKWKFWSLMLHFGWPTMLAFWLCGVTLAFVLCMADILPPFSNLQVRALGFTGVIPSGCWIQVAGLLANIGGAVLFPYLPSRKSDLCFLDFVCIDQADTDRMQEGIMSISGFLSASAELRVLWSAPLLSRLWCVFEIAAYRKLNPGGKITMSPVNNEVSALMVFGGWQMFTFTLWIARAGVEGSNPLVLLAVMTFVFALLMPALALSLYRNHTATAKLRFELANFDVMKVNCSNDFDRDCIHAAIIEWYGSLAAFSEHVRGPFREEVLKLMRASGSVSSHYIIWPITPLLCFSLDSFLALCKAGAPVKALVAFFFSHVVSVDLLFLPAVGVLFGHLANSRPASDCGHGSPALQELMNEVETTIRSTLELDEGAPLPEICFTCLGGWMARASGEEEDEFAQPEPWPWAREELNDFFGILSRDALRQRLDERVGLAMS
ncbi:unnamed protein product [Durusdinium trenchii]|uniref:Uncharacterized protein n=1 Tax=Durusdinium trenchii TaxID=1381693 RepID=A0ABP0QR85_9DINO